MSENRRPKPFKDPLQSVTPMGVYLTPSQWRAICAMLFVAANNSGTNLAQATLFHTLYDTIQEQVNIKIEPVLGEPGEHHG